MWEEKYELLKGIEGSAEIESRLMSIENGLKQKISHLEAMNLDFKDAKLKLELKLAEKQKEIVDLRHDFDNYVKRDVSLSRSYKPESFLNDTRMNNPSVDFDYVKKLLDENERVKTRLINAESEIRLRDKEHELQIEKMKTHWQKKFAETNRKQKIEVKKLINLIMAKVSFLISLFYKSTNFLIIAPFYFKEDRKRIHDKHG